MRAHVATAAPGVPSQVRAYAPEDPLTHGVERGRWLLDRLGEVGVSAGESLVDVGCGYGGLSLAYAQGGRKAYALDLDPRAVSVLRERVRSGEAGRGSVLPLVGSALSMPLADGIADRVLMIGVLEWVGYSTDGPVREAQRAALGEARRVLREGGLLVIGTKNRLFPRYAWRDGQAGKPVLNCLPQASAGWLAGKAWGLKYRSRIYSLRGWRRLIQESGFAIRDVFVPIFNYQFPLLMTRPWTRVSINGELDRRVAMLSTPLRFAAVDVGRRGRRSYYRGLARLGLLGLAAGSFMLICRKEGVGESQ